MLVEKPGSRPPWIGLAAAVWVQVAAGNGANFVLYSAALKSALGCSQQQLTILAVANDTGESLGVLPGVFCNRFPPWLILLIGAFACFVGYGTVWLAVSEIIALPYWLVSYHSLSHLSLFIEIIFF